MARSVARLVAGDHPLFELIMRRYKRRLYLVALSVLRDGALAQDAYIVAFVRRAQQLGTGQVRCLAVARR